MRSSPVIFTLASFLNKRQLIKERICSFRSKFFPIGVDSFFGQGSKQDVTEVVSLFRRMKKLGALRYCGSRVKVPWCGLISAYKSMVWFWLWDCGFMLIMDIWMTCNCNMSFSTWSGKSGRWMDGFDIKFIYEQE